MFQSFRILLVEDDDGLRSCLGEFLSDNGWEVGEAGCGEEALALFLQQRFDFTILDYHLPGITGLELFRQLANRRRLPAILMSGLASTEDVLAARHAGFCSFLRKPLELSALRATVENLIRSQFGGPLANLPPDQLTPRPLTPRLRPRQRPNF